MTLEKTPKQEYRMTCAVCGHVEPLSTWRGQWENNEEKQP